MDTKIFFTIFWTVFIAELGDKTQLSTLLFASDTKQNKWLVFAAASLALVFASGIGVFAGSKLGPYLDPKILGWVAGVGFVLVGVWTIFSGYRQ